MNSWCIFYICHYADRQSEHTLTSDELKPAVFLLDNADSLINNIVGGWMIDTDVNAESECVLLTVNIAIGSGALGPWQWDRGDMISWVSVETDEDGVEHKTT